MNPSHARILASVALVALCAATTGCGAPYPPLVAGATAAGGDLDVCPSSVALLGPTAVSPELNARLAAQFPPGSSEQRLITELRKQQFSIDREVVCKDDKRIRAAYFRREGFYTMYAYVYWKADHAHRIVWTKGVVAFEGL